MISRVVIAALVSAVMWLGAAPAVASMEIYYFEPFAIDGTGPRLFQLGGLNGQHGWVSVPERAFLINWGVGGNRDGVGIRSRGLAWGFEALVNSPRFAEIPNITGEDYVLSMIVGFKHRDTTWYVTPKNTSRNRVLTRVRFDRDGSVYLLVPDGQGGGAFERVPGFTWEANSRYVMHLALRGNGTMQIAFDDRFNALPFIAPWPGYGIEAISVETNNERSGRNMLIDDIRVRRGRLPR